MKKAAKYRRQGLSKSKALKKAWGAKGRANIRTNARGKLMRGRKTPKR